MKIPSLLNPFCGDRTGHHGCRTPIPASVPCSTPQNTVQRRQKLPKDAPVFSEGINPVGNVNYPPYEAEDNQHLRAEHDRFQVFPRGEIYQRGVRHIPYNSDKKDFLDKTGRDAFEMFQYTYKRPDDEKEYVVVWDYNVGLVRMTPFFKSCKHTKTIPAKALNQNAGLKDISYSITGGALVCQGYWMPYQAAKAIAATFCYDIRWALTPVFGNDFPAMCLSKQDPRFAKFLIDPAIVQYCTKETDRFRREGASYRISASQLLSPMETPKMHFGSLTWTPKATKQRRTRPATVESSYGTGKGKNDKCAFSPHESPQWTHLNRPLSPSSLSSHVSPRSQWTALNTSSSPATPSTINISTFSSPFEKQNSPRQALPRRETQVLPHLQTLALPGLHTLSHIPDGSYNEQLRAKRTHSKVTINDPLDRKETATRPQTSDAVDVTQDSGPRVDNVEENNFTQTDIEAAELLLSLYGGGGRMLLPPPTKRTRRGSTM